MNIRLHKLIVASAAAALLAPGLAMGQQNIWEGGAGNWLDDATWNQNGQPIPDFDAEAAIGSTVLGGAETGLVTVDSDIRVSDPSSTVVLGDGAGTDGALIIEMTGALAVVAGAASTGDFYVGRDTGAGALEVNGGILEVENALLSTTGLEGASSITLSGAATVSAASATFDRALRIEGGSVSLSTTGNVVFGLAGTHTWSIPSTGASTVSVGGNADLGGVLEVVFPDGTPAVGSTFDLVDAATVDDNEAIPSGFSFVDTSSVSGLGPGERFATQTVAGGVNGAVAQLVLEQHPVLVVDRDTGAAVIRNPGGVATIDIDSYAITSPTLGALDDSVWTSFEDQGAAGGGWLEANPSANTLSELNAEGEGSVPASTDVSLGDIFVRPTPAAFGDENEDLRFRYSKPDGGFIEGDIIYTGVPNNTLTLNVDPSTGETQIINGTAFTVSIDAYVIDSPSGSLDAGNGAWDSLEDQAADGGNWFEADAAAERLSELLVTGGRELGPDDTINLGFLFDEIDGIEDLEFRFAILPADAAPGDFNADGVVDAADYAAWRNALGDLDDSAINDNGDGVAGVTVADYQIWRDNFGSTGSSGAAPAPELLTGKVLYGALIGAESAVAAVPEPAGLLLLVAGSPLALAAQRRRRS